MIFISHRGNLDGPVLEKENDPKIIEQRLNEGYDVEIDVLFVDGIFHLGHDSPDHVVLLDFLLKKRLWCHAMTSSIN